MAYKCIISGSEIHELLIEIVDVNNAKTHAQYSHFSVGSELEGYAIKVLGSFNGNGGDSLSYHAGMKFSTRDKDQDAWAEGSCAQTHGRAGQRLQKFLPNFQFQFNRRHLDPKLMKMKKNTFHLGFLSSWYMLD